MPVAEFMSLYYRLSMCGMEEGPASWTINRQDTTTRIRESAMMHARSVCSLMLGFLLVCSTPLSAQSQAERQRAIDNLEKQRTDLVNHDMKYTREALDAMEWHLSHGEDYLFVKTEDGDFVPIKASDVHRAVVLKEVERALALGDHPSMKKIDLEMAQYRYANLVAREAFLAKQKELERDLKNQEKLLHTLNKQIEELKVWAGGSVVGGIPDEEARAGVQPNRSPLFNSGSAYYLIGNVWTFNEVGFPVTWKRDGTSGHWVGTSPNGCKEMGITFNRSPDRSSDTFNFTATRTDNCDFSPGFQATYTGYVKMEGDPITGTATVKGQATRKCTATGTKVPSNYLGHETTVEITVGYVEEDPL
jgi:hypothetical protein